MRFMYKILLIRRLLVFLLVLHFFILTTYLVFSTRLHLPVTREDCKCGKTAEGGESGIRYIAQPTLKRNSTTNCSIYQENTGCRIYVFVKSACAFGFKRNIIRRTWARVSYIDGCEFQTFFVLGKAVNETQASVQEEINVNLDILQYDGPDVYRNITTKTLSGMRWAASNLHADDIYVTADDDMLIDVMKFRKAVRHFKDMRSAKKWPEFPIVCGLALKQYSPIRLNSSKWFVTLKEYKWNIYPKFCLGGMYATSISMVKQLVEVAAVATPLHLDDVWITGILRLKLSIPDYMLVEPQNQLSTHLGGFYRKTVTQAEELAMLKWKLYEAELTNDTVCFFN